MLGLRLKKNSALELSFGIVTWLMEPAKESVAVLLECSGEAFATLNLSLNW